MNLICTHYVIDVTLVKVGFVFGKLCENLFLDVTSVDWSELTTHSKTTALLIELAVESKAVTFVFSLAT